MDNIKEYLLWTILLILLIIFGYIFNKLTLKTENCIRINKNKYETLTSIFDSTDTILTKFDVPLKKTFVKTAYNCCCAGNFKNDYVDMCALDNCIKNGVRAFHFEIYSLNNNPIIASSTIAEPKYKEIYNYLEFATIMSHIKNECTDSTNTDYNLNSDPLFLIFEIHSDIYNTYTAIYNTLTTTFKQTNGTSLISDDSKGNPQKLMDITLNNLKNKIIFLILPRNINHYTSSSLNTISVQLNSGNLITYSYYMNSINKIGTTIDFEDTADKSDTDYLDKLNILIPNKQLYNDNYDFKSSGIRGGITFIGMKYQFNGTQLKEYNQLFNSYAFSLKYYTENNKYYSPVINQLLQLSNLTDSITKDDYNKINEFFS